MMNKWQRRVQQEPYTILILDSSGEGMTEAPMQMGMTEAPLYMEIERQGHRVIHAHWNNGNLRLEEKGGITYLVADAYEAKVFDPAVHDFPLTKRVGALVNEVERKHRHPATSLCVKEKEDGLYLSYPPIRVEVGKLDGLIRVVSGWEDRETISDVLDLQEKLEKKGVVPLNDVASTRLTESKIVSQEVFEEHGITTPLSLCLPVEEGYDEETLRQKLQDMGVNHFVVKGEYGSHGENNHYTDSIDEALTHIRALMDKGMGVVVQEKEPAQEGYKTAHYYRVTVVGDEVVGYRSVKYPDEGPAIRLHDMAELTDQQKDEAVKIARVCGQDHAGVDFGGTGERPSTFETNSASGMWIHESEGQEVIPKVVAHLVDKIDRAKAKECRMAVG